MQNSSLMSFIIKFNISENCATIVAVLNENRSASGIILLLYESKVSMFLGIKDGFKTSNRFREPSGKNSLISKTIAFINCVLIMLRRGHLSFSCLVMLELEK